MARTQTMVQLSDSLVEALDERAARDGVSRSQLIRDAVEAFLADDTEHALTRRIVAGYKARPPATPDAWGDLDAALERATVDVLVRLDAEEAERGTPW
jgi:Arc/MetJ-type ribon-helix-helix transcriptional regulator